MNEKQWTTRVREALEPRISAFDESLFVQQGTKIPYAYEIVDYDQGNHPLPNLLRYETDLLISERLQDDSWKPRLIIEIKLGRITTHDAITYSEKASNHKRVHPYLRYGIMIGAREHYPLPGRLFRHGGEFDFMLSWGGIDPQPHELDALETLVKDEINASRLLEEMIYNSRSSSRKRYFVLHKALRVSEIEKEYNSG